MRAKTSGPGSIIPLPGVTVKALAESALVGLPVQSTSCGLTVADDMTSEEFLLGLTRLLALDRSVIVHIRFRAGDLWNALHEDRFKAVLRRFHVMLASKFSEPKVYKSVIRRLRECGWVASKWAAGDRDSRHSWTWFVTHPESVASEKFFLVDRFEDRADGQWVEVVGTGDRKLMARLPSTMRIVTVA